MQNHNSLFISLHVTHYRDVQLGVTGLRVLQQGLHRLPLGKARNPLWPHSHHPYAFWHVMMLLYHCTGPCLPFSPFPSFVIFENEWVYKFCIAFDFFKTLMKKSKWGGKSHMNELTWNHKTYKWLIILYDQECCQNNLLAISASWWRMTAFGLNPHSVSRKGHQVPLMRKMKNASDFLRSSKF